MKIRAHESFSIRKGWLHKGIKNILANNRLFNSQELNACDILGLGANMVKALRYWLTATGVMEEIYDGQRIQRPTTFGLLIDEYDRYYEEQGTNYLLHYKLASNKDGATAWYWFFNEYRPNVVDKDIFISEFAEWIRTEGGTSPTQKILEDEFSCLIRTYYAKEKDEDSDPEETKECPLGGLELLVLNDTKKREYKKNSPSKDDVNPWIAYAILSDTLGERNELLISAILSDKNSLGRILNLDKSMLMLILESIEKLGLIDISRTAGLDVIKIKQQMSFLECVERYYLSFGLGGNNA